MKDFLKLFLCGAAIGTGMIIPGVSGGTIAVIMRIYDKLINAITSLKSDFKNSVKFLFPILLGAIVGIGVTFIPLKLALEYAPLPTVLLFVGFMLGSLPDIIGEAKQLGIKGVDWFLVIATLSITVGICFIPGLGSVDLSATMAWWQYILLFLVGLLASCALVIPGISGSMLLLILGYYQPIFNTITLLFTGDFLHSFIVLAVFGLGIIVGFFTVAKIMQYLLNKFERATRWAILGFVIGSVPAILITFDYANSPLNIPQIIVAIVLLILGCAVSYYISYLGKKRTKLDE
ncbi:MAG: DUF368 domain-containing protein [Clostridiales bacterium]|nr:DUF368 domain-containing protein [Clostridiales bacterium]